MERHLFARTNTLLGTSTVQNHYFAHLEFSIGHAQYSRNVSYPINWQRTRNWHVDIDD